MPRNNKPAKATQPFKCKPPESFPTCNALCCAKTYETEEVTGNFIALGIIGAIRVPKLPIVAGKLCVFTRWVAGG